MIRIFISQRSYKHAKPFLELVRKTLKPMRSCLYWKDKVVDFLYTYLETVIRKGCQHGRVDDSPKLIKYGPSSKVHRSWTFNIRTCRSRSWNRTSIRLTNRRSITKPSTTRTTIPIRYPRIRPSGSYRTICSDDRLPSSIRVVLVMINHELNTE